MTEGTVCVGSVLMIRRCVDHEVIQECEGGLCARVPHVEPDDPEYDEMGGPRGF